jgi:spore coat polysaccharide biosynthesis protein SpsF (cytidylyltransferase family)
MNASLFSGFNIVTEMEGPLSSPTKSRSAFNSPVFKAKSTKFDDIESLEQLQDNFVEPILQENPTRFTLFPIQKPKLFQKYKNHVSVFWTPEEIDLAKDMKDWIKLSSNEQMFIKNVLGFFAG